MNAQHQVCSCGESNEHVVARRRSANNVSVLAWSSGEIGSRFQLCHRGRLPSEVMWAVLDEVELFEFSELPSLIKAARELHRRGRLNPAALRARACKLVEQRAQA